MTSKKEKGKGMKEFNSIHDLEYYAKDEGFDSLEFTIHGLDRTLKAKWLDAYMGLFKIEGQDGFHMVNDWHEQMEGMGLSYKVEE